VALNNGYLELSLEYNRRYYEEEKHFLKRENIVIKVTKDM
jgi:hypothetical protein